MRKLGLQVIKLITLLRHFPNRQAWRIYCGLLFGKGDNYVINTTAFKNKIYLRKDQSDPFIFEQVFVEQQYKFEYKTSKAVKFIIDAGANVGLAAIYFATKYPEAQIISIEPDSGNFAMLLKNTSDYKNIHCVLGAIWDKSENLFIQNKEEFSAGYMMESLKEADSAIAVKGYTVTEIMEKYAIDNISIFKIDIEGSEKALFENGSEEWLPKTDVIIAELHDWLTPGTSKVFFNTMSKYDWITYIRGENIISIKTQNL